MPGIMPSQVVEVIDSMFPITSGQNLPSLNADSTPSMRAVLDLLARVPDEMFNCPAAQFADLVAARAVMVDVMDKWMAGRGAGHYALFKGKNCVAVIRQALSACSDELPPSVHADLLFISDEQLRDSIRVDVGTAHRATSNGEWKAATVLAGAAIEALLHWRLSQPSIDLSKASRAPVGKKLIEYGLQQYIDVAKDLALVSEKTAIAAHLARGFRNLIHPARAERLQEQCTRATAFSAIGAMEAVIEDLARSV